MEPQAPQRTMTDRPIPVNGNRAEAARSSGPYLSRILTETTDAATSTFSAVATSSDGRILAVGGARLDKHLKRCGVLSLYTLYETLDPLTGDSNSALQQIGSVALDSPVTCLAWSPDLQLVICGTEAMTVEMYRTKGLKASTNFQTPASKTELRRVTCLTFDTEIVGISTTRGSNLVKGSFVLASHASGFKTLFLHRYSWKTAGIWTMETSVDEDRSGRFTIECSANDTPVLDASLAYVITHKGMRLQVPGRPAVVLRDRNPYLTHAVSVAGGTRLLFLPPGKPAQAVFQLYDSHTGAFISSTGSTSREACDHPLYGCLPIKFGTFRPVTYTPDGRFGVQACRAGVYLRDGNASPLEPPMNHLAWEKPGSWDDPIPTDCNDVQLMHRGRVAVVLPESGKQLHLIRIHD